jgi:hypothetical protein
MIGYGPVVEKVVARQGVVRNTCLEHLRFRRLLDKLYLVDVWL